MNLTRFESDQDVNFMKNYNQFLKKITQVTVIQKCKEQNLPINRERLGATDSLESDQ